MAALEASPTSNPLGSDALLGNALHGESPGTKAEKAKKKQLKKFRKLEINFYRRKRDAGSSQDAVKKLGYDRLDRAVADERRASLSRMKDLLSTHIAAMDDQGLVFERTFSSRALNFSIQLARYGSRGREQCWNQSLV